MEAELMKALQCLNRRWTCDSYFSLRRPTNEFIYIVSFCIKTHWNVFIF